MCLDKIERANFLRFLCFFIDIGTDTLLQLFLHFVHQKDVVAFFSSDDVRKECQELCSRNVLSKKQLSIINHSCPDIFSFDISLLIALLSNLFSGKIKPPIGGWETNNPHRNDIKVAADIVRLRLLRNEVVGHSSRAKLSEGYFQELWERLETIILRLYSFLKPNSICDISKQIDSYKTMNLDEQRERQYQEKLKTLQDACIEIVQIQDKVDDLLRKCQDFAQFFSTKRKRFSLYIKLLLDGGRLVLTAYLQRELSKRNITIQEVIVEKRAVLEKYSGDTETIQHLNEAVDKWVIGYLATVILVCFEDTVTPRIKEAITGIKDAFLGYARLALVSLNDDKFSDIYVDLVNNLRRLSLDLGSDIESKCEEFIDTYRRKKQENEPDTDDDFDLFKSHGLKMKELEDVYKETLIHLKKVITEMEERGIPFKKDYVLQLQLMTYGEKKMFVEDILVTVITAILRHDESTSGSKDIWEALHLLLDQINNISGVKVESVERHCILISITCSSSLGLLKLIEYVESTLFQELLYKLSTDLMALFGEVLVVTGNFNFESLHDLSNCLSSCFDTEHEPGGLTLHVTCSSVEGINQVVRLMKTDTTKHTVKQIAQHLSEQVQENVSLQIGFPDLQDFFREVGNNGTNLSSSQRETAQSDPFSTKDGKDTTNPGKKSEEFGLQQENFVTTTKTEAEVCRASLASITQTTNELLSIQEQANIDVVLKNIYMRQGEVVKTVQDPADTCSSQLKRGDSELHGTDNTLELEIKSLDKGNVSVEEGKRIARTGYLGDEGYTPGERRRATMSYTATRAREMNNSRQVQPPFVEGEMTDSTFVYAAIDFGTAYSGYAFAFRNELQENVSQIHGKNWQHSSTSKLSKTPSVILFNESKSFDSFGYEAEEKYAKLAKEYKHEGWRYFKHFKMALHGKKKLGLNLSLIDDQGKKMPAIEVFAAAIKHLKDDLMKTLRTGSPHIETENIMWIITVPTIWNYGAKQFMKEAAVRAGISEHRFTFALEPEAGAVYCAHIDDAAGRESILRENSEFMVVDLGGGTADITVCKVETDKTLSELYPPSGGPWGGNRVDKNIYQLLEEYFGTDIMQNMEKHHKTDYLEVREGIERKKRDFGKSDSKEVRFNIPYQLVGMNRVSRSDITRQHQHSLDESVQLVESKNQVRISNEKFEEMFKEPIQHLIEHLQNLFANSMLAAVDTILMIGGFSESMVMQNAVRKSFPNKKVVIPDEAELAVVKGAVIVGYRNSCIRSRKLPYTYGISIAVPFDPKIHRQENMFFPPGSSYPKCENIFKTFIHKGDIIVPGITKVHHPNFTVDSTSKTAHIEVYQSFADTRTDPSYTTDPEVEETGVLELSLESKPMAKESNSQDTILYKRLGDTEESEPEHTDKRSIDITMHFGAFEVEVEAKEHDTDSTVRAKFNCLYH